MARKVGLGWSLLAASVVVATAYAEDYSPAVGTDYPKQVFFGDLHLHSNNSADAYSMGNLLLDASDAFRFARGEQVMASSGQPARLKRPLDFLAVTDHAEFLGLYKRYALKTPDIVQSGLADEWDRQANSGSPFGAFPNIITNPDAERDAYPDSLKQSIWLDVTRTADEYNQPGVFTAFSGYEWTSMVDGNNLHRCVIFQDESAVVSQMIPYDAGQSRDPEDLWNALKAYEQSTGGAVMAIPHNGNISNGMMWDETRLNGKPLTREYAQARTRWEPIAEVTQIKGDSETHPSLSPDDEFADFERWDKYNIMNTHETKPEHLPGGYARSALKRGLAFERKLDVNPYQFGMIGSTDDHTSLATASEDNFFGKFPNSEPGVRTADSHMAGALVADWELGASGLAAVWATENTRDSLFSSMRNREVYATTGSRIALRFFGGFEYAENTVYSPDFVKHGYARGVPMGGELTRHGGGKAPTFLVQALKDPDDANLDQIQIVKGWIDRRGRTHEKIYYVALSDGRQVDRKTGKPPAVGSTVDLEKVSYTNSIGAAQLSAQWTDPDFDPRHSAFYYARVIEIPKPRWTEYDRKYFDFDVPEETPRTVQDRAYSSPIWYRP